MADYRLQYTGEQTNQTLKESIEQKTELGKVKTNITQLQSDVLNKINKGSLSTINGQNLENGGNIEISGKSVFDMTPYIVDQTHISVEGYNLLRQKVESGEVGAISVTDVNNVIVGTIYDYDELGISAHWLFVNDSQHTHTLAYYIIRKDGSILFNLNTISDIQANPTNLTNGGDLNTIGIGDFYYTIPKSSAVIIRRF